MKTLKQIIEGAVVMSDFKLDRKGRKYKAHRMSMGGDMNEAKEPSAVKDGKLQGHMVNFKPKGNLSGDEVVNKVKDIAKSLQSTHPDKVHKGAYSHGYGEYSFNDKHRGPKTGFVVVKSKEHLDAVKKHIKAQGATIQEEDTFTKTLPRMGNKALDSAKGLINPYEKAMSDMTPGSDYYKKNIENNPEAKAKVDDFMKSAPKASDLDSSVEKTKQKFNKALTNKGVVGGSVTAMDEDASIISPKDNQANKKLPSVRDIVKADKKEIEGQFTDRSAETQSPYNNRPDVYIKPSKGSKVVNTLADFESVSFSSFNRLNGLSEMGDREAMNKERSRVLAKFIKGATPKNGQVVNNIDTSGEVTEARGRPAGAATLAKRAAAASKPREDDDEGEHYDSDSGVEADQHIHVQLKKAADSDQKPFEVSFRNGKKHSVSQKVAKDVLSATERLKPEHRKNVHDEIHQSYDNLMSVHRLIARR